MFVPVSSDAGMVPQRWFAFTVTSESGTQAVPLQYMKEVDGLADQSTTDTVARAPG
jgi:hypothetical protein